MTRVAGESHCTRRQGDGAPETLKAQPAIVTGSSAAHQAGVFPDRVERTPKRYVGRRVMLLGGREVRVPEAVGAVLASFLGEAMRHRGGSSPSVVVLSHPARWEAERIEGFFAREFGISG